MIYLDNSATTPLLPAVRDAMCAAMEHFGNPSSVHIAGQASAKILSDARNTVRRALSLPPERPAGDTLVFTASGTEANNLALRGVALAKARNRGMEIITTDSEHPSVLATLDALATEGFTIKRLPTTGGAVQATDLLAALTPRTLLLSIMHVNNETGARYDVPRLFALAKRKYPNLLTHTDCVQAFGKIPLSIASLGADLVTLSAHKIGGPKGVGALYISERVRRTKAISPVLFGGGQELGLRSGTENTIGIAGFAAACETVPTQLAEMGRVSALRERLLAGLPCEIKANLPASPAPHIVSITLPHIKSETMLNFLSGKGICVSAGSACASHGKGGSPTLLAFGLFPEQADTTLRISLSHTTTETEIDTLLSALHEGTATLVRMHP